MNTCPHCGSLSVTIDKAGNHWFSCGSANRFRSQTCIVHEPLFLELQSAKARIDSLKLCICRLEWIASGGHPVTHWGGIPVEEIDSIIESIVNEDCAPEAVNKENKP